jgi:acyl-[acyl-carrier-protein] desaturase
MVTEEALPSYSVSLNRLVRDPDGDSDQPWAKWLRGWTAEENRHGDLLNAYLRLTGRVDMRAVELTVHHLLNNGFNPRTGDDPYGALAYTSFQERATKVSHKNVGRIVETQGDANLARICARIAGDESRHELFYTRMMDAVLDRDPEGGMLAIRRIIRGLVAMPGKLMYDGKDPDLFDHFAVVAQRTGVYTAHDYARILDHLVRTWDLAGRSVSGAAARAQDYLCGQTEIYRKTADRYERRIEEEPRVRFSWIYDRTA